jgi:hypothetical protein
MSCMLETDMKSRKGTTEQTDTGTETKTTPAAPRPSAAAASRQVHARPARSSTAAARPRHPPGPVVPTAGLLLSRVTPAASLGAVPSAAAEALTVPASWEPPAAAPTRTVSTASQQQRQPAPRPLLMLSRC